MDLMLKALWAMNTNPFVQYSLTNLFIHFSALAPTVDYDIRV